MSTTLSCFFRHASRTLTPITSTPTSRVTVSWTNPIQFQSMARRYAHNGDISGYNSRICAILGAQWGDEGKGKMIDILAKRYDIVGRFNGGANAGHTLVVNKKKFAFHLLPCGMLYDNKINVIGNGVVLDIPIMLKELESLDKAGIDWKGRLLISNRAQILFDVHKLIDGAQEKALAENNIGTTKKGIGPCYASKATRNGIRVGELIEWNGFEQRHRTLIESLQRQYGFDYNIAEELERYRHYRDILAPMVTDTVHYLNTQHSLGKTILAEGANAALLDIDHGTYPYVTSSATTIGGISTGLGIAGTKIDCSIGVVKAYTTRVGSGPFPTELNDAVGEQLRKIGGEFGTTTGRPRRCGWLDIPVIQYSHMLNNYNSINITKLDVLSESEEIKIGIAYKINGKRLPVGYMPSTLHELSQVEVEYESHRGWMCDISNAKTFEELPQAAQNYLTRIQELVGVPVSWVGVGAGRDQMATKGFRAL